MEGIYQKYGPRAYALAVRLLGCEMGAEAVAREVLFEAVRRLVTSGGESTPPFWLYRVTVNAVLTMRRQRGSALERDNTQLAGDGTGSREHQLSPLKVTMLWWQLPERVEAAIRRLPDPYRDLFVLSEIEKLSAAEVRSLLGLSPTTMKEHLLEAKRMLRDALGSHG